MLYNSPCDEPNYFQREYGHLNEDDQDDFDHLDLEDQFNELLEVNWESPR